MKRLQKFLACLLALTLAFCVMAGGAFAAGFTPPFDPQCEAAYIVNTDTNIIVYAKNEDAPLTAASLTKLVTAALLLQTYGSELDTAQLTAHSYLFDYVYGKDASHADIRQREVLTPRSLLYAMMLPSANEGAYIVAAGVANDNIDNFVYMMNAFVKNIGCTNTVFYDPCGLDERNTTTAKDTYLILRYLLMSEWADVFAEVCSAPNYEMPANIRHAAPYTIFSTNKMVDERLGGEFYRSYNRGGKTGVLGEWQNFAGWHTQNGETYISVVLKSPNAADLNEYPTKRPALYETGQLMDWVYSNFSLQAALDTGEPITEIPIKYSAQTDTLMLYPADEMLTILPADGDGSVTQKIFNLPEFVAAPIKQGDVVGTVTLTLSGKAIGTVDLLAGRDVERNMVLFTVQKLGEFFSSLYFRIVVGLCLLAVVIYLVWFFRQKHKNRNIKKVRRRP
ncbi:MAG: D-alanyl-D-alanine carboxypeptidase [Oscillospiraceae bacterium]|nr:D-alanyl-D-alanine carboxypeptidase [Oscillospiraceae bacterium]